MKSGTLFFLFLLLMCGPFSWAQKMVTTYNADSSIVIVKDARMDDLVKKQKEINLQKQTMPGFRIQIYFGANRPKAIEAKMDFNSKHPETGSYISYQQPNFKVRVGDFRTRLEAQKFLKNIQGQYSSSFIVPDDVRLPVLK
ncbi:MAG: SPOR domain-containing protein [Bacteroidetes bacterium]|nr:SPOR domain-containing protein [Bacteroidota bacterium]